MFIHGPIEDVLRTCVLSPQGCPKHKIFGHNVPVELQMIPFDLEEWFDAVNIRCQYARALVYIACPREINWHEAERVVKDP